VFEDVTIVSECNKDLKPEKYLIRLIYNLKNTGTIRMFTCASQCIIYNLKPEYLIRTAHYSLINEELKVRRDIVFRCF